MGEKRKKLVRRKAKYEYEVVLHNRGDPSNTFKRIIRAETVEGARDTARCLGQVIDKVLKRRKLGVYSKW